MCYARAQLNIQLWRNRTTTTHLQYSNNDNIRSWKSHTHTHTRARALTRSLAFCSGTIVYVTCVLDMNNEFRSRKTLVGSRRRSLPHTTAAGTRPPDVSERSYCSRVDLEPSPGSPIFIYLFCDKSSPSVVIDFLQVTTTRAAHNGPVSCDLYSRTRAQCNILLLFLLLIGFYYRRRFRFRYACV